MSPTRSVTFGIGALAGLLPAVDGTPDLALDLGPHHPSAHGLMRLHVELDGARIVHADPEIGFLHRGAEKLFEVRDYRQGLVLANRHDWLSAFSNEVGLALAVERMLGMEVPERATWIRTLVSELGRVLHHLAFLGAYPWEHGSGTAAPAYAQRESLQRVLESAFGGRMHLMATRIGGLREDVPDGWLEEVSDVVSGVRAGLGPLATLVHDDASFAARTRGVAVLSRDDALEHGVSGPVARASGLDVDLRRDDPGLAYAELRDAGVLRVASRTAGDALARHEVLLEEVQVSLDLADACLARVAEIGPGPVNLKLPKVLRAPEGHTYAWFESPGGVNGYLLVSRGEKTPWRLKLRTASFNNVSALGAALQGGEIGDLVAAVASFFFVIGDVDK